MIYIYTISLNGGAYKEKGVVRAKSYSSAMKKVTNDCVGDDPSCVDSIYLRETAYGEFDTLDDTSLKELAELIDDVLL